MTSSLECVVVRENDQVEKMREIRNECALFMTRHQGQISKVEQIRWWNDPSRPPYKCFLFFSLSCNSAVGYGTILESDGKSWLTGGLISAQRGKGLGRALFLHLIQIARLEAWLEVQRKNVKALNLYQSLEFEVIETLSDELKLTMKRRA